MSGLMATLNIAANTDNTGKAMSFVDAELTRHDFPADLKPEILIAVEEVFVNIASYAYKPEEEGYVKLSVMVDDKAIIRFKDSGKPFNPLEISDPNLDAPIVEREIGGLGIHFVKNLMDEVDYVYAGEENILTISKGRSGPDGVK